MKIPPEIWELICNSPRINFDYASGHFFVDTDGTVYIMPDMPEDMRERFISDWKEHLRGVKMRREKGIITSWDKVGCATDYECKIKYL